MVRSFRKLENQFRAEYLISYLMSRGVLPSFAFPINVGQLHVLAEEMREDRADDTPSLLKFRAQHESRLGRVRPAQRSSAERGFTRPSDCGSSPLKNWTGTNGFATVISATASNSGKTSSSLRASTRSANTAVSPWKGAPTSPGNGSCRAGGSSPPWTRRRRLHGASGPVGPRRRGPFSWETAPHRCPRNRTQDGSIPRGGIVDRCPC